MPTYAYRCRSCGHEFEVFQKISDSPIEKCERCGEPVNRVFHPVGIVFKGSGFYKTDNREASAKPADAKPSGNGQKPKEEPASAG